MEVLLLSVLLSSSVCPITLPITFCRTPQRLAMANSNKPSACSRKYAEYFTAVDLEL